MDLLCSDWGLGDEPLVGGIAGLFRGREGLWRTQAPKTKLRKVFEGLWGSMRDGVYLPDST